MKSYQNVLTMLTALNLKGMSKDMDSLITEAETHKHSYLSFLTSLLTAELDDRHDRRYRRNLTQAHFPVTKKLDAFEYARVNGITKTEVSQLLDFSFIDKHENLLFFGPPGIGKTHLAISLGYEAIGKGYTVSFERITSLIKILKNSDAQRTQMFRLNRILKSNLLIIDEIGYTPIERREAILFFNLVSELYEKQSIIITSNKSFSVWAEMMGDEIMTTAMLDRLLHHSRVFNLDGKSYRIKNQKEVNAI